MLVYLIDLIAKESRWGHLLVFFNCALNTINYFHMVSPMFLIIKGESFGRKCFINKAHGVFSCTDEGKCNHLSAESY